MPRRSGTDVLFRNGRVRRFFLPGAFCFSDAVLSVPPCAALSSSACIGRRPRLCRVSACVVSPFVPCRRSCLVPRRCSGLCCVVILGLHRLPSPFVPCRRSCLVPRRCPALCRVVILGLHRSPSPFVPCRRSDLRRIVIRCLRRVAVPVCGWRPPPQNSADGLTGILPLLRVSCGLSLLCGDSGRVARPLFCSS